MPMKARLNAVGSGTVAGPCQVHVSTVLADELSGFSISFPKLSPT